MLTYKIILARFFAIIDRQRHSRYFKESEAKTCDRSDSEIFGRWQSDILPVANIQGVQGVQWTPENEEKKSVLGHSLAINVKNCLYLYRCLSQRIYFLTRSNDFYLSAQAWLQVVQ